jgi:hypothetical protein
MIVFPCGKDEGSELGHASVLDRIDIPLTKTIIEATPSKSRSMMERVGAN